MSPSISRDDMAVIPAGQYQLGSTDFYPEESPIRRVTLPSFRIDVAPVTNAQFERFVVPRDMSRCRSNHPTPSFTGSGS